MIPTNTHQQATLMQSAQPLLLNQMPMLATAPGVQFILKPQHGHKMQTATATPQGLILQQGSQQIIQLQQPRSQPMVRVLTNSVQLAPSNATPTYVQMSNIPMNNTGGLSGQTTQHHLQNQIKKKPKAKVKKRLDLANLMKLSGEYLFLIHSQINVKIYFPLNNKFAQCVFTVLHEKTQMVQGGAFRNYILERVRGKVKK